MSDALDIGSRRELFVDRLLIDSMDGTTFRLHSPQPAPMPENPIRGGYMTVMLDSGLYRAYYRDYDPGYTGEAKDGNEGEITFYAESRDGREWSYPKLGLCKVNGSSNNNAVLNEPPYCHNFSPFKDLNPAEPPEKRYKALAGTHQGRHIPGTGLHAFHSADGIHWSKTQEDAVISETDYAFDSQNVSFWSPAEGCYVCYYRTWRTPHGKLRTISRRTSSDFLNWSPPVDMAPNLPDEHLYTSQTHPYFRAPHIYIALPTRYNAGRVGAESTDPSLGSTDILFMSSRAGSSQYDRLFTEAWMRPGLDPQRWASRGNYVACGVVPTGPEEMSIYHAHSGRRFVLRKDGFISINAGAQSGRFVTKPLIFSGDELELNYSTSAAGSVNVEIIQESDAAASLKLEDCRTMVGDAISQVVNWKNSESDVSALAGKPVRLRFEMREADIFSIRFRQREA